ncbi:cupin domain-containing protein [Amycolatopsis sp. NPDC102389]|uniref:cupin domain-containing protein n=1 Tax=Amycolatopsis sp. NPDC102389 TaxID=3363941 RepID=UPI003827472F
MPSPDDFTAHLGLQPLPVEGGRWAQSWRDETASAIYYLLVSPETSAPHRLDRLEIYAHHAGAPVRMLLLFPDGRVSRPVLGPDVAAGQRPQVGVPAGVWQASVSTGEWSLLGTVVVPPYTDDCVEFRSAAALAAEWPDATEDLAPWLELE